MRLSYRIPGTHQRHKPVNINFIKYPFITLTDRMTSSSTESDEVPSWYILFIGVCLFYGLKLINDCKMNSSTMDLWTLRSCYRCKHGSQPKSLFREFTMWMEYNVGWRIYNAWSPYKGNVFIKRLRVIQPFESLPSVRFSFYVWVNDQTVD